MKNRGMTLLEVLVAGSLASLVLLIVTTWFQFGSRQFQEASSSSQFGKDMSVGLQVLRRDLKETALHSLRSSPKGASMATCRPGRGEVQVTERGDLAWQGHYFYTIEPGEGNTGNLVRWFEPSSSLFPRASKLAAQPIKGLHRRVVLRSLVRPKSKTSTWPPIPEANELDPKYGGFRLSFLRSDGTLSKRNPVQLNGSSKKKPSGGNTGLVQVDLATATNLRRKSPNFLAFSLRVRPQR